MLLCGVVFGDSVRLLICCWCYWFVGLLCVVSVLCLVWFGVDVLFVFVLLCLCVLCCLVLCCVACGVVCFVLLCVLLWCASIRSCVLCVWCCFIVCAVGVCGCVVLLCDCL